uniref:Uncharacterized protein n=1 Tax=Lepeophtheirus salmonis TaxID=72036 RepID=A0A0K2T011_LEPSM
MNKYINYFLYKRMLVDSNLTLLPKSIHNYAIKIFNYIYVLHQGYDPSKDSNKNV